MESKAIINSMLAHFESGVCTADRLAWHCTVLLGVVFNQKIMLAADKACTHTHAKDTHAQDTHMRARTHTHTHTHLTSDI